MADELPSHTKWLRTLPCCNCAARAPSEVHHRVGAGMAVRSHDCSAIPLCASCHREFHDLNGRFKGKTRDELRVWHDEKLRELVARIRVLDDAQCADWDEVF